MRLFDRLQIRFDGWKAKLQAKKKLQALGEAIAACNGGMETREIYFIDIVKQHIESAESNYNDAITSFKQEDYDDCLESIDSGELHIKIAETQIPCAPDLGIQFLFDDDSCEQAVGHLGDSIIKTKLAVEYSNCDLSKSVRQGLKRVTGMFNQAVEQVVADRTAEALSIADSGILMLHYLALQMETDNQRTIVEIKLHIANKIEKKVKELAERLAQCRRLFNASGAPTPPKAQQHFEAADEIFRNCIDCIAGGDLGEVDAAASAGMLELNMSENMLAASGSDQEYKQVERRAPDQVEFKSVVAKLVRAVNSSVDGSKAEVAERHLRAALRYYNSAVAMFSKDDFAEADRLARAAYLDLDYARQVVTSKGPPRYRDI